jgi:hypothetical protein
VLGCNFALLLDHISRETEYFIRLLDKLSAGDSPLYQVSSAREAAFWLRIMADHAKFIIHRIDPSERSLIDTSAGFSEEFDELYLQGRDFVSMLRGEPEEVPSFRRFLQDARVSTMRMRDFNRAAEALIAECKLVGIMPALLADHMRREADHFLLVLALLDKAEYVTFDEDGDMEYLDFKENVAVAAAEESVAPSAAVLPKPGACVSYADDDGDDEDGDDDDDDRQPLAEMPVMAEPEPEPVVPKQPKVPKYKWNGKWPRPLGSL